MRIANYLRPDCVALRQRADSLTGAVQQMVTLLDGTDNLTDTAVFAADVRARLALGGVCVGNGLAIPHAKSTAVRQLQLAALTLDPPLPCDTPDGKPLDLLVMIAAPAEANDLHVQVLAELATLFLDTDFCARLRESETPEAFCRAISAREEQAAQEPPSAPSDAAPGAAKPGYQLLAVTACPTGIAHTYLAAEALQQAAQARGLTLKVETNGAAGVNDELTDDEIQAAECVIVAVDCSIPLARFVGKRLVYASAGDAVRDADRLLERPFPARLPSTAAARLSHQRLEGTGPRILRPPDERHLPHAAVCCGGRRDAGAFPAAAAPFWPQRHHHHDDERRQRCVQDDVPRAGCVHRLQHCGPPRLYAPA